VNQIVFVGNQGAAPRQIGDELSLREIARENMKVLDVEVIVPGHVNALGQPYDIDQMYDVRIEDDDVNEPMYVYSVSFDLTLDHGLLTRLRLCRKNTICAYTDALPRKS
jgi:prophage tail gpP-like protein